MTEAEKVLSHAVQKAIDFLNKGDSEAARIYLVTASKMVKEIMDEQHAPMGQTGKDRS